MNKKSFTIWILLVSIPLIYAGILFFSIQSNNIRQEEKIYNEWRESYVMTNDKGTFVNTSNDKDKPIALSEGQGYGMIITILAAKNGFATEKDFKPFVTYYENYQLGKDNYLMNWKQEKIEGKWSTFDNNNATDGDLDIAFALLKAGEMWPDSTEDYHKKGLDLLESIKEYNYNPETKVLSVGNWATDSKHYWNLFRPSDVIPVYFNLFYQATNDSFWKSVSDESLNLMEKLSDSNENGLIPDFAWIEKDGITPASANDVATKNDGNYSYNALRIPIRLMFTDNEKAIKINKKLLTFLNNQETVRAGYALDGEVLDDYQSVSYSAPLLLATKDYKEFSSLYSSSRWIMSEAIEGKNYYGDSLKAIVALQLSNEEE